MSTEYLILSKVIDNGVNGSTIPLFLVPAPTISLLPAFVGLVIRMQQCHVRFIRWCTRISFGLTIRRNLGICSKLQQLDIFTSAVYMLLLQFLFRNNSLTFSKCCGFENGVSAKHEML